MTRTEEAIQALVAAITTQAHLPSPALPEPKRNNALPASLFQAAPGAVKTYLNVWDGDGGPTDETIGADDPSVSDGYDIEHRASVEWICAGGADADREAAFDAGLIALHNAVKLSGGQYLGGTVSRAAIETIVRSGGKSLVTDGLPNMKAADVTILLTFTSSRPF